MKLLYSVSAETPLNQSLRCSHPTCACRLNNFIWVSRKLGIVYFETPKCGCTSIKFSIGVGVSYEPSHFAMAYLVAGGKKDSGEIPKGRVSISVMDDSGAGSYMSLDEFSVACRAEAKKISEGIFSSEPVGAYGFEHFFGSPEQAIKSFPGYRKFMVIRHPFDRLLSAWRMLYHRNNHFLRYRVFQCEDAKKEKNSFSCFLGNLEIYPNHHFESLGKFLSYDVAKSGGVELVLIDNLKNFWEELSSDYGFPYLDSLNVSEVKPDVDFEKSEFMTLFSDRYSDDLKLMEAASSMRR